MITLPDHGRPSLRMVMVYMAESVSAKTVKPKGQPEDSRCI